MPVLHGRGFARGAPGTVVRPRGIGGGAGSSCWRPPGRVSGVGYSRSGWNLRHRLLKRGIGVALMTSSPTAPRADGLGAWATTWRAKAAAWGHTEVGEKPSIVPSTLGEWLVTIDCRYAVGHDRTGGSPVRSCSSAPRRSTKGRGPRHRQRAGRLSAQRPDPARFHLRTPHPLRAGQLRLPSRPSQTPWPLLPVDTKSGQQDRGQMALDRPARRLPNVVLATSVDGPADRLAAEEVEYAAVDLWLAGRVLGDVGQPQLVGSTGHELRKAEPARASGRE
jgi:hypothetical protein